MILCLYRPSWIHSYEAFSKKSELHSLPANTNPALVSFPHHLHDYRDDYFFNCQLCLIFLLIKNNHFSGSLDKKESTISNRKLYIVTRQIVNLFRSWKTMLSWEKARRKFTFFFNQDRIILNSETMFLHLQMRAEISSWMFANEGETCCLQKNKARLEGYLTHEFKQLKLTVIIIEKTS